MNGEFQHMTSLQRSPMPYYHQIGAILRERINNGEFRLGERVPSEDELCQMFSVSRATVSGSMLTPVLPGTL